MFRDFDFFLKKTTFKCLIDARRGKKLLKDTSSTCSFVTKMLKAYPDSNFWKGFNLIVLLDLIAVGWPLCFGNT